ncbi:mesenchyme-specific cell surface glycoprotein-like isoform X1 [Argopecten irradians]|uniref:mesenchyme-specific cell surface glycoprotein-like isoform X1 n=1 Tax=Argopecten irradians TaxID=31199 RepID=UPI003711A7B0
MRSCLCFIFLFATTVAQTLNLENVGYLKLPDCRTANMQMFSNSAMKAVFHETSRLLYVAGESCVHVVNVGIASAPTRIKTQLFNDGLDGKIKDIAVCDNTIAVLLEGPEALGEGHVYLCDPYSTFTNEMDCTRQNRIIVGDSPTNMEYTSDCKKLLVTNSGRAGLINGVFTDPIGSVTIIDKRLATEGAPCTRELSFTYFDDRLQYYMAQGLRWTYRGDHNNGIVTKFSNDLEPSHVTINGDNTRAYVTLPVANGIAEIDLTTDSWVDMYNMGYKDLSAFQIDASDSDFGVNMVSGYTIRALKQPTAAVFVKGSSIDYVVTANTGAMRTYTMDVHGVDYTDNARGQTVFFDGELDNTEISSTLGSDLNANSRLGRLHMSTVDGRSFVSGLITNLYTFGGRELGFWDLAFNTNTSTADDLETIAASSYPSVFNGDCSDATLSPADEADSRSDDLGPEPNVLATYKYNETPLIAAAARNGLMYLYIMAFNTPSYQNVVRLGNMTASWADSQAVSAAGDGLISDMGFIPENLLGGESTPVLYVISQGTGSVSLNRIVMP